ncbi:hypothetical protein [Planotetraspora sp. GP83]|uniref:hypothetical protein n=1 Tax=Planotetraspora sp. GP83 TaxID=3156264 RepID=UPI0035124102
MSVRIDDLGSAAELPEDLLDDVIGGRGGVQSMYPVCAWAASTHSNGSSDPIDIMV